MITTYLYLCVCLLSCVCLWPHGLQPTRLFCPWDFPGKNTGVGYHFLLQRIFPTQGSNSHLLHWQVSSLSLSYQGSLYFFLLKIPVYTVMNITHMKQRQRSPVEPSGQHSSLPQALCHMRDPNRSSVREQSKAVFPWHPGKNTESHLTLASALQPVQSEANDITPLCPHFLICRIDIKKYLLHKVTRIEFIYEKPLDQCLANKRK